VVTLAARNVKKPVVAPMLGSGGVCVWRESGVRRSVSCSAFVRNPALVAVKMF
jgi:hypothetical protein